MTSSQAFSRITIGDICDENDSLYPWDFKAHDDSSLIILKSGRYPHTGAVLSGLLLNDIAADTSYGGDQSHRWVLQEQLPISWDLSVIKVSTISSSNLILGLPQCIRLRHRLLCLPFIIRTIGWWWRRWWRWRWRRL